MNRGKKIGISWWVNYVVLPITNLVFAFFVSSLVVLAIGHNPLDMLAILVQGSLVGEQLGYTLFYSTSLVFTGLAVAIAYHSGLFNIGGEGQLVLGGFGLTLVCIYLGDWPAIIVWPLAVVMCGFAGGVWGGVAGWLQAKRGCHVVIVTIMMNFISYALLLFLLKAFFIKEGYQGVQSELFAAHLHLPTIQDMFAWIGLVVELKSVNIAIFGAALAAVGVWLLLWLTPFGYSLRVIGQNDRAARYGGIKVEKHLVMAMFLAGMLAALAAVNIVLGDQHRLTDGFSAQFGFVGIAVAFMGRQHPFGIVLASLLFGMLVQGATELSVELKIDRQIILIMQGIIILVCGALENLLKPAIYHVLEWLRLYEPRHDVA